MTVEGSTLRAVLDSAFAVRPELRSYVLDDQGTLRKHITVFVSGVPVQDRITLADAVPEAARVEILQALSGG